MYEHTHTHTSTHTDCALKSAAMYDIFSISIFHPVCVHAACTAARSAPQIIDGVKKKKKKKITHVHLLTNLFISGARDAIYHGKQLGSNNSHRQTIWLMVTEENVLIRHGK